MGVWGRPLGGSDNKTGSERLKNIYIFICHLTTSQFTNTVMWIVWRNTLKEECISTIFQEIPQITELKTVTTIIANNPFRRKFTPLHMGVNVSFLTLELALP